MDQLRPKTWNPLNYFVYIYVINIVSSIVVMDHSIFWNAKTFKIKTKVDDDAKYAVMGLNDNEK